MTCQVPITIFIFNRYKAALQLLGYLKKIKPEKLFIVSDAPRADVPGEAEAVLRVRKLFEEITWECEVYRNYSVANMGCDHRIPDGLSWVFDHVDYSIILEDDCIPNLYFHQFCQILLEKYKYDDEIMFISGTNLAGKLSIKESYFFSHHSSTWGWATWKRAWAKYQRTEACWNAISERQQLHQLYDKRTADFFINCVNYHFCRGSYPWDYVWWSCCLYHNGISISPAVNLIKNIGFAVDATHTLEKPGKYSGRTYPMTFPILHPKNKDIKIKYGRKWRKTISVPRITRLKKKIVTVYSKC
jgi:hypothetical protein